MRRNGNRATWDESRTMAVQLTIQSEASDMNASTDQDATTSAGSLLDVAAECAANSPTNAQDSGENVLLAGWATPKATSDDYNQSTGRQNLGTILGIAESTRPAGKTGWCCTNDARPQGRGSEPGE